MMLICIIIIFLIVELHVSALRTVQQHGNNTLSYHKHLDEHPFRKKLSSGSMQKIKVKEHVAFHFNYAFQPVIGEGFITRTINIDQISKGLEVLGDIDDYLQTYCSEIRNAVVPFTSDKTKFKKKPFMTPTREQVSRFEAQRLCESYGYILPEIYTEKEWSEFRKFMIDEGFNETFAGTFPVLSEDVHRFIYSGMWVHSGFVQDIVPFLDTEGKRFEDHYGDYLNVYMYRQDGRFQIRRRAPTPYYDYVHRFSFRYKIKDQVKTQGIPVVLGNVICQTKKPDLKILLHNKDRVVKQDPGESAIEKHNKNMTDTYAKQFYALGQQIHGLCIEIQLTAREQKDRNLRKLTNTLSALEINVIKSPRTVLTDDSMQTKKNRLLDHIAEYKQITKVRKRRSVRRTKRERHTATGNEILSSDEDHFDKVNKTRKKRDDEWDPLPLFTPKEIQLPEAMNDTNFLALALNLSLHREQEKNDEARSYPALFERAWQEAQKSGKNEFLSNAHLFKYAWDSHEAEAQQKLSEMNKTGGGTVLSNAELLRSAWEHQMSQSKQNERGSNPRPLQHTNATSSTEHGEAAKQRGTRGIESIFQMATQGAPGLLSVLRQGFSMYKQVQTDQRQDQAIRTLTDKLIQSSHQIDELYMHQRYTDVIMNNIIAIIHSMYVTITTQYSLIGMLISLLGMDTQLGRIGDSLSNSITSIEDVASHALHKSASMLLISDEELTKATEELNKNGDKIFKNNMEDMISFVTVNPVDKSQLIAIINTPGYSKTVYTATELYGVPTSAQLRYKPIVSCQYAAVSEDGKSYYHMTETQYEICQTKPCFLTNAVLSMYEDVCGPPLLNKINSDICKYTPTLPDGSPIPPGPIVKTMSPDGCIFSTNKTIPIRLDCDFTLKFNVTSLTGEGVLHTPRGCKATLGAKGEFTVHGAPPTYSTDAIVLNLVEPVPKTAFDWRSMTPQKAAQLPILQDKKLDELKFNITQMTQNRIDASHKLTSNAAHLHSLRHNLTRVTSTLSATENRNKIIRIVNSVAITTVIILLAIMIPFICIFRKKIWDIINPLVGSVYALYDKDGEDLSPIIKTPKNKKDKKKLKVRYAHLTRRNEAECILPTHLPYSDEVQEEGSEQVDAHDSPQIQLATVHKEGKP